MRVQTRTTRVQTDPQIQWPRFTTSSGPSKQGRQSSVLNAKINITWRVHLKLLCPPWAYSGLLKTIPRTAYYTTQASNRFDQTPTTTLVTSFASITAAICELMLQMITCSTHFEWFSGATPKVATAPYLIAFAQA